MLLPSALTCDSSTTISAPKPYYPSTPLFASPPISPPATATALTLSHDTASTTNATISSLYSTCRALQSMLTTPSQLPSPPTQHLAAPIISSPPKLKLRNRGIRNEDSTLTPRKKITKRSSAPPRGLNKRRRAVEDDLSRETFDISDCDSEPENEDQDQEEKENTIGQTQGQEREGPRTPKRMRLAPEILPLGLERSDFHSLHLQHQLSSQPLFLASSSSSTSTSNPQSSSKFNFSRSQGPIPSTSTSISTSTSTEQQEEWTTEEDRILVELVLEKLKLSKSDWQDCARSLGKDRGSVGRRWKSLMAVGEVGLKGRSRGMGAGVGGGNGKGRERGRIYGSWR